MPKRPYFGHAALAITTVLVIAACSSDTPTSPLTASQSLTEAASTITLSRTRFSLCYPAQWFPASTRGYWGYPMDLSTSATPGVGR
jgi:hypothetical protein